MTDAAAWPVMARGQPRGMPVIGYLSFGTPKEGVGSVSAFLQGLAAAGYVEGRDVAVEFRDGNCCRLLQNSSNAKWP